MSLDLKDQYDKIFKYCYFRLKDAYLAEDLTQEAFLRYLSQNTRISSGKQLAYLYTVARNLCIDTYKKTKTEALSDDIPAESSIDKNETSMSVQQAVAALNDDLQEIILLRFANDLCIAEICNIVGLSRFAVYRKINCALKQLRLTLRKEDFF